MAPRDTHGQHLVRPASLTVIGLGAIGGSLAWQARRAGVPRVVGYSPNPAEGVEALKAGAVTELADSPATALRGAELVVLAVPPRATIDLIGRLASSLESGAVLTDVCSVKAPVIERAEAAGIGDRFAGGHPLAGTHRTGFASARPDRLRGCIVYLCETSAGEGVHAASGVREFWEDVLEAVPVMIDASQHDRQLAWTSHLPQAVAYALASAVTRQGLAGTSFGAGMRDTTRLAASDPAMWTDILLYNSASVTEAIGAVERRLAELRDVLGRGDEASLREYLAEAQRFRQGLDR